MLIVYDSFTGNVDRFVKKTGIRNIKIEDGLIVDEPFVLVTYTIGFGDIPQSVIKFLDRNSMNLKAVASSGNRNWGSNFAIAGDKISKMYNVPNILKFEFSGRQGDIDHFKQRVETIQ